MNQLHYLKCYLLFMSFFTIVIFNRCKEEFVVQSANPEIEISPTEIAKVKLLTLRSINRKDMSIVESKLLDSKRILRHLILGDTLNRFVIPILTPEAEVKGYLYTVSSRSGKLIEQEVVSYTAFSDNFQRLSPVSFTFESLKKNGYTLNRHIASKLNGVVREIDTRKKIVIQKPKGADSVKKNQSRYGAVDTLVSGDRLHLKNAKAAAWYGDFNSRVSFRVEVMFIDIGCDSWDDMQYFSYWLSQRIQIQYASVGQFCSVEYLRPVFTIFANDISLFYNAQLITSFINLEKMMDPPLFHCIIRDNWYPRVFFVDWDEHYEYEEPVIDGGSGSYYGSPSGSALNNQIVNKPFALIDNIDCYTVTKWLELANHKVGQEQLDKLKMVASTQPSWLLPLIEDRVEDINKAYSSVVNMDYFPVEVYDLPTVDGVKLTASQFIEYIRKNINSFVDPDKSRFIPYNYYGWNDTYMWQSGNPLGAMIGIDIPGVLGPYDGVFDDNGAVIVSKYDSTGWVFSTIFDMVYGHHPVSGNRAFGYEDNGLGYYTFYTRGVDRLTDRLGDFMQNHGGGLPFISADALWKSFQQGIYDFVESHGGRAYIVSPTIRRPDWDKVKSVVEGHLPVSTLSSDC